MNLQLKFIVLAFSAFALVSAASTTEGPENDDLGVGRARKAQGDNDKRGGFSEEELAKVALKLKQEDKVAQDDQEKIDLVKHEICDVVHAISETGGTVFVRQIRRDLDYVFSNENVDRVSSFLKKVPVNIYLTAGVFIADSMVTGFVCDRPSQAVVLSGLACYAWMNLPDANYFKSFVPDLSSYAKSVTTKCGNFITSNISAGIWGTNKKD